MSKEGKRKVCCNEDTDVAGDEFVGWPTVAGIDWPACERKDQAEATSE
jgi:hypothetical protein